jgi:DNA-binding NtrC family response regulator
MEAYKIFIVEDDPWYGEVLSYHLSLNPDYVVTQFTTGMDCLANLHRAPDLITIDFSLPDITGDKLYEKIRAMDKQVPVIMISGQEEIAVAIKMLKLGVKDYLVKDENTNELLWNAIAKIRETGNLKREVEHLREELGKKFAFDNHMKGQSPALQQIFKMMEKAASSNINVSVTGETGTGKEVVAKSIHYNSERKSKPFVAVNMAAIPRELIESELFGHEKGAFTGAIARKVGKFEEAHKGTLFLDEIAELDLSVQSKLLRVLQERELTRVGGNERVKLDVRLVVASHKNLSDEVKKGNFREDLFYRVIGLPIGLPPLRERGSDILILAKFFVEQYCEENKLPVMSISQSAREKLMMYNYPGNVRELKAVIDLACVMSSNSVIEAHDVVFAATSGSASFAAEEKTLRAYTCDIIRSFLKKYDGDVLKVADKLDIGKSTIYKMIQTKEIILD